MQIHWEAGTKMNEIHCKITAPVDILCVHTVYPVGDILQTSTKAQTYHGTGEALPHCQCISFLMDTSKLDRMYPREVLHSLARKVEVKFLKTVFGHTADLAGEYHFITDSYSGIVFFINFELINRVNSILVFCFLPTKLHERGKRS